MLPPQACPGFILCPDMRSLLTGTWVQRAVILADVFLKCNPFHEHTFRQAMFLTAIRQVASDYFRFVSGATVFHSAMP